VSENETTFGEAVRQMREARSIGLRQFAARVGMSATYLSKVERGELLPPSEQKIRNIAKQLGQNEDVFLALAGRLSPDIQQIIRKQPRHLAAFLRTADGLPPEKIARLTDEAARMKHRRSNSALPQRKTK
jgi:HTH-type transcriptional regulator, competence development regulator